MQALPGKNIYFCSVLCAAAKDTQQFYAVIL
jgi:hypothetical protein